MNNNDDYADNNNFVIIGERKKAYLQKQEELKTRCYACKTCSIERCDTCIVGLRLRWLETEYADVTGFTHDEWKNM